MDDQGSGRDDQRNEGAAAPVPGLIRRRKLAKVLAATGAVTAVDQLVPGEWVRPLISIGVLPAHAQTSGEGGAGGSGGSHNATSTGTGNTVTTTGSGGGGAGQGGAGGEPPVGGNGGEGGTGGAPPGAGKRLFVGGQKTIQAFAYNAMPDANVITTLDIDTSAFTEQLAVHNGNLIVTCRIAGAATVRTYPLAADASEPPTRVIGGAANLAGLSTPYGVLVVDDGDPLIDGIYVGCADFMPNSSIRVFPITQNSDAAPARLFQGSATLLNTTNFDVRHLARNGNELLVCCPFSNKLLGFPLGGGGAPGSGLENQAPTLRNLTVPNPRGVAVLGNEIFVVANGVSADGIRVFALNANGSDAPTRMIGSTGSLGLEQAKGLWIDNGLLYIGSDNDTVVVVAANAVDTATPLLVFSTAAGTQPTGVAVADVG